MTAITVKTTSHPKRELRKQLEIQLEKTLAGLLQKVPAKKLKKHVNKAAHELAEALVRYSIAAHTHKVKAPKIAIPGANKKAVPAVKKAGAKPTVKAIKKTGK